MARWGAHSLHGTTGVRVSPKATAAVSGGRGVASPVLTAVERGFEALLPRPRKRPAMEIERETMLEIAVSVGAVLVFVALMVGIGVTYGAGRVLSSQGGIALLAAMGAFVLLMTGIGYFLAGRKG